MESLYFVLSWHCHRRCVHCYDDRFRPYVREELERVVGSARAAIPRIVANLPDEMTYLDRNAPLPGGGFERRRGRIILAGGEVLTDPVREPILYPTLDRLREKYGRGGVRLMVQTTGDLVTEAIVEELLAHGATTISVSGMDDFHVGMTSERRAALRETLTRWFEAAGMRPVGQAPREGTPTGSGAEPAEAQEYSFFGATPDAWIGRIWPRGRAWLNDLSQASLADNFCNAWSGGLGFLDYRYSGSEVSIDPDGNVYPCCMKTKAPLGNLTEETLVDILDSLAGHPAFEAINAGRPERMGLTYGWDVERFLAASETTTPAGRPYRNLCIGCDRFFSEVLAPVIGDLRRSRLARRADPSPRIDP